MARALLSLLLIAPVAGCAGPERARPAAPVRILFDTDLQTDCDDAGALAVLHALADAGEAEILGLVVSSGDPWAAGCADAINTWYGRPDLPIGRTRSGAPRLASKFTRGVAEACPQDLGSADALPEAADLYRRILEAQPDGSVTLLTVGYATALAQFLRSGPDALDLARRKVRAWVCMAGNFPRGDGDNVNFTRDPASAAFAVRTWPGRIEFCGREIGHAMRAGARLAETPPDNPVRRAYELYFGGAARDRHCADLAAVLYAVRGAGEFWEVRPGRMDIRDDATFAWRDEAGGPHARLVWKAPPERVRGVLDELLVRAPRRR